MRFLTTRRVLGVLTVLAVLGAVSAVWFTAHASDPLFLEVGDLAGDDLPLGERVRLGGYAISFDGDTLVLGADTTTPLVSVEFERTCNETISQGAIVIVEGRLARSDLLDQAEFVAQKMTGPYEAAEPER